MNEQVGAPGPPAGIGGLAWEDGRLHALGLGQMGDEVSGTECRAQERGRRWRRRLHKWCPVCLEEIDDTSMTCIRCMDEWRRILQSPRRLAQWIVAAAWLQALEEPGLRHTVVWRER